MSFGKIFCFWLDKADLIRVGAIVAHVTDVAPGHLTFIFIYRKITYKLIDFPVGFLLPLYFEINLLFKNMQRTKF